MCFCVLVEMGMLGYLCLYLKPVQWQADKFRVFMLQNSLFSVCVCVCVYTMHVAV